MMLNVSKVIEKNDIETVVLLATEIWNEHYINIISKQQIDYMLNKYQSYFAIKNAINSGYLYFIIVCNETPIGYFALRQDNLSMYLDKLYVLKEYRGQGISKFAIEYAENITLINEKKCIHLTVNKNNRGSILAYKSLGFNVESSVNTDIGGGFIMDDYQMYKFLK
ncbi:MAG: GNAT family N-acetyltransferase [Clostridia bacterium]